MTNVRRPTLWIAIAAVAALAAGLAIAWRQAHIVRPQPMTTPIETPADTSEGVIDEALGQSPIDSVAFKSRWIDDLAELDLAGLDADRREILLRFANAERCTCGCGYTLATCRINDPTCPVSGPRVQRLLDSVRAGRVSDQPLRSRQASR